MCTAKYIGGNDYNGNMILALQKLGLTALFHAADHNPLPDPLVKGSLVLGLHPVDKVIHMICLHADIQCLHLICPVLWSVPADIFTGALRPFILSVVQNAP